jgi:hypothetical protein
MELKIKRSQGSKGLMGKNVTFIINARANLTNEEQANIKKYGLGKDVLYNSEEAEAHAARGRARAESGTVGGLAGAFVSLARATLSLRITIDSLMQGQQIECKDLGEALAAEEAIHDACQNLVGYIHAASLFDGTEHTIEIKHETA